MNERQDKVRLRGPPVTDITARPKVLLTPEEKVIIINGCETFIFIAPFLTGKRIFERLNIG